MYGHVLPSHHVLTGHGALCEYVAVSPAWITRKPDRLSFLEAASLPTAAISVHKLLASVPMRSTVFVNGGSGGVGTILLQLLKRIKGATVVSSASAQTHDLIIDRLRADETVDYRAVGALSAYLARTYGRHFDVCIDLMGDMDLYKGSTSYMKPDGIYLAFGGGLGSTSFIGFLGWSLSTVITGYWPKWLGAPA